MNGNAVTLSIVMPVYNEAKTIRTAVEQVLAVDYPCAVELVIVNDGSGDDTPVILDEYVRQGVRVVHHDRNRGKGAAVKTGVEQARGSHLIILDADLEYSPADIPAMVEPVLSGKSDHVFGVRIFGLNTCFRSFRFAMGGRMCTLAANVIYDACLTDLHTCMKLMPLQHFRTLMFKENGFGLDTELSARLLRGGVRPYEVPISYNARSVEQGKKITWKDGLRCLAVLFKIRFTHKVEFAVSPQLMSARSEVRTLNLAPGKVSHFPVVAAEHLVDTALAPAVH